jgi:hypothetical protein
MNDRIKELANQMFSMEQFEYAEEFLGDEFMEKFAELVIQECITLMDEKIEEFDDLAAAGDDEFIARSVGAYQIKELIEDHFGVEE